MKRMIHKQISDLTLADIQLLAEHYNMNVRILIWTLAGMSPETVIKVDI